MRSLTASTQTARASASASPVPVLKIEFGGTVGTKYYAGRDLSSPVTAEGRVIDWGGIYAATALKPEGVVGDVRIRLADADGVLAGYRADVAFQGRPATVYQLFAGLGTGDMVPLASGIIAAPVEWDEATPSLAISITDISTGHDRVVGHVADRESFPEVSGRDEGMTLPIVYGRVRRATGVHVRAGAVARLAAAIPDAEAMSFIVDDASRFPQDEPITVRIGMEHIAGSFTGNTFTATARGAQVAGGSAGGYTGNPYVIVDTSLSCSDGQYVGNFIRMLVPYAGGTHAGLGRYGGGVWQYRRITRCEAPGVFEFYPAFSPAADSQEYAVDIYLHSGAVWNPPAGTPFSIVTLPSSHETGGLVRHVLSGYTYVVNDMPSVAVRRVECFGIRRVQLARLQTRRGLFAGFSGGMFVDDPQIMEGLFGAPDEAEDVNATLAGWVTIEGALYTVDTNDTTTFPGLGRAVTTVTMWLNPSEMPGYEFTSDEIRVDIEGAETDGDGTGTLIENPADVVKDVLVRFGSLTGDDYDAASFSDCSGRMGGLCFGFSLTGRRRLLELAQDLAFQCRTTLLWEGGVAKLKWLTAGAPSPVATIGDDERAIDSLRVAKSDRDELYTEVLARWTEGGEERELSVSNAAAESAHGRRTLEAELWAHPGRDGAEAVARFWLERLKDVWEVVHLSTFLNTLELEREDVVTLSLPDYYPAGMRAVVEAVEHRPGSGAEGQIDRIHYRLRVPYFAGCETVCEAYCETAGCESSTELAACTGTCETSCQGPCELGCQNAFELGCGVACESMCTFGCQQSCTGMNMPGCSTVETGSPPAGACESACQSYCQYQATAACDMETCMVTCVAGCESACQIACTSDCELAGCESAGCTTYCTVSGCESACQTGIQHCYGDSCGIASCQLGCTVSMTIACSGDCQTICVMSCTLDCQLGCTASCETAGCTVCCEQSCTSGCEDGCQSSCEVGCESLGCQTVNCETTCEVGCETGCETSCETGCEVTCETGCEVTCEYACTLVCEHGCQNQGEGCYLLCQALGMMS